MTETCKKIIDKIRSRHMEFAASSMIIILLLFVVLSTKTYTTEYSILIKDNTYSLYNKANGKTIPLSKDYSKLSTSRDNNIALMENVVYNTGYTGSIKGNITVKKEGDVTVINSTYSTFAHYYDKATISYEKDNISDMKVELEYRTAEFNFINLILATLTYIVSLIFIWVTIFFIDIIIEI